MVCGMCERKIRGGKDAPHGVFDPPHKTAVYCMSCFGRIHVIAMSMVEQAQAKWLEALRAEVARLVAMVKR